MNTPNPCNCCKNLYVNALTKDKPCQGGVECKLGKPMGCLDCRAFLLDDVGVNWLQDMIVTEAKRRLGDTPLNLTLLRTHLDQVAAGKLSVEALITAMVMESEYWEGDF